MLASFLQISDQDTRVTTTAKGGELFGQVAGTSDGRAFAYGLNGTGSGTAIAPGKLTQGALSVSGHTNKTGTTTAAGVNTVSFTVSSTAVTTNQYQDGYFYVNAGTGVGQTLRISGNTSSTSTGTPVFNLHDPLIIATLASDSKFSVQPNSYSKLILTAHGSSTAVFAAGVPTISIPDANYGWFQVSGTCAVLQDTANNLVGESVIVSPNVDGAVTLDVTSNINPKVGYMQFGSTDTQYQPVFLTINS